ncbi:prefoldin subunit beta [Candidatus Woesearchaeota archaeon]|nr:prefoldin subunit beta [Candidatus Woesearchaeota archaeon]
MSEEQLNQLRIIEQQLSATVQQKQAYDQQLVEIENALKELTNKDEAYHIVGSIMIKKDAKVVAAELKEKKNTFAVRVDALTKQEESLRHQAQDMQENIMKNLQQGEE